MSMEGTDAESPTANLQRILRAGSSAGLDDPLRPDFFIPRAPEVKRQPGNGLKKAVQRLFGKSAASTDNAQINFERPLLPLELRTASRLDSPKPFRSFSKTLSAFGSRILSPLQPSKSGGLMIGTRRLGERCIAAYSLSMDELAGGLAAAPPTPSDGDGLQDRILANHKACMRHERTQPAVSLPQLEAAVAKAAAEDIRLDPNGRVFLLALTEGLTKSMFLSKSSTTKLGRMHPAMLTHSRAVSRLHCELFMERSSGRDDQRAPFVVDVGSQSGTFVNGVRLSLAGQMSAPCALSAGDIIQLGSTCADADCVQYIAQ